MNTISTPDNSRAIQPVDVPISFPLINPSRVITPHHDALVLTLCINNFDVHKVLVDPSSAIDLLQLPAFRQMKVLLDKLSLAGRILSKFNRVTTLTMGDISLPVKAGRSLSRSYSQLSKTWGPYNAIVSRAWLHAMKAVPSTYHQTISYLTSAGQINLLSSQLAARQCYQLSIQECGKDESFNNPALESRSPESQSQFAARAEKEDREQLVMDPLESILLGGPGKHTYVSSLLSEEEKEQLRQVFLSNINIFAWTHSDMTGINPTHASHKLNVIPFARPDIYRVQRFHLNRHQIIQAQVDNLLDAGFIREIKYSEWLANVVVVPKKEGKWRVCVDYTDLNDTCPKDNFPFPCINQIVDASSGHGMLSFLDVFSGYYQIPMYPSDVEKTVFITPHGLFCYNVMSFKLKNVRATYQRLVTKMFKPLLGTTMEVNIDDMLVKSKQRPDHVTHLQEAFDLLKAYSMKLNPSKCAFGVSVGRFLGFMVTQRGIEANPA